MPHKPGCVCLECDLAAAERKAWDSLQINGPMHFKSWPLPAEKIPRRRLGVAPSYVADGLERVLIMLYGPVPAKKNKLRPRSRGSKGRAHMYDEKTAGAIEALATQARIQWGPRRAIAHPELYFRFEVANSAADKDGMLTTVLDCLKTAGVLHDDSIRWCNGVHVNYPAEIVLPDRVGCQILLVFPQGAAGA